jgi:glycosyltransferase involved in cell wall biosynthesis
VKLVVAGEPLSEAQQNLVSELGIVDQIAHVGPVSNAELECLYQGARALVFPSFAEGFGWPVLEAQACGCPVITSDRPPMSDIGGPYCISVDPADAGSIAAGVRQLLAEAPEIRSRRIEEGRKNAARFSENQMIGGYFSAYKETMQSCQPC